MNNAVFWEVSLFKVIKKLWKRIWIIGLIAILGAVAGYEASVYLIPATYKASIMLYVNNTGESHKEAISNSDISAAQSLVDTYIVILKSETTLSDVLKDADCDYKITQLKQSISAGSVDGTEIFKVSVTDHNPELAYRLANSIAEILPDRIAQIVKGSTVSIVDYANTNYTKIGPDPLKYGFIGGLLGAMVSIVFIVIRMLLDNKIRSEDDITQLIDAPILGRIPNANNKAKNSYYMYYGTYGKKNKRRQKRRSKGVKWEKEYKK